MGKNRQDPSQSQTGVRNGRKTTNVLQINWQERATAIWAQNRSLQRKIADLHRAVGKIQPHVVGQYEDFRRKFRGKLPAHMAYASALFDAGEFDRAGITLAQWVANDEEWSMTVRSLVSDDAASMLSEFVEPGTLAVRAMSTPQRTLRRIGNGDPVECELHIGEYLHLTLVYSHSNEIRPIYILALEWSGKTRDWQIFNFVGQSLLDIDKPKALLARGDTAIVQIPVGVRIVGPPEVLDLYVLAQHSPFNAHARSYLDNLGRRDILTTLEMNQLVKYLFMGEVHPHVAATSYSVVH